MQPHSYTDKDLEKALNKAKIGLMQHPNSVFISTVLFSLKFTIDRSMPTAAVDGVNLFINPDFFMSITPKQRIGLLAHEAWHIAFEHVLRLNMRDLGIYNQAADHVINLMLLSSGFELPEGGLADKAYEGMSADEVYNIIFKDPKNKKQKGFQPDIVPAPQGSGNDQSSPNGQLTAAQVQENIKEILVKASIQSKLSGDAAGTVPAEIDVLIDKLLNPKLPWTTLLQNYVSTYAKDDYSWAKPNKRYFPDYYMPSAHSEKVGEIAVAVDTSGSVSQKEFTSFISEIHKIKESLNPEKLTIIDFDTKIKNVHVLKESDDVRKVTFKGRGGTNLTPVFNYYGKNIPKIMIVFSDLECTPIKDKPKYPVIWVCINNPHAKVNFGKLIHIEI